MAYRSDILYVKYQPIVALETNLQLFFFDRSVGALFRSTYHIIGQNDDSSYTNFIICNNKTFHFCPTSSNTVFYSSKKQISRSKATGLNNISARLIRECADVISAFSSDLFNKSLTSGIFPHD